MKKLFLSAALLLIITPAALTAAKVNKELFGDIPYSLGIYFRDKAFVAGKIEIDSVDVSKKYISIYFNQALSEYPFRPSSVAAAYALAYLNIPEEFKGLSLRLYSNKSLLEDLVPPCYRENIKKTSTVKKRRAKREREEAPLITRETNGYSITKGLQNRHIAMWQSHGYYYEQKLLRWEWQRARIFQTVEDLYTQSYVLPFLVPMLENAGAAVLLPRERDTQVNEVIVDNDSSASGYFENSGVWSNSDKPGFKNSKTSYLSGENPFMSGTARITQAIKKGESVSASFTPEIPEKGEYAVYVAYQTFPSSTKAACYTIHYKGGSSSVRINQAMGGGTWIYLGTYLFDRGSNKDCFVEVSYSPGKKGEILSADAVKFGGGMGNIARCPAKEGSPVNTPSSKQATPDKIIKYDFEIEPTTSGHPRFTEGSRYWLQWAGFSDTIYSPNKNANDYNDDYTSRGRWVNVLSGGSKMNPEENGYNIPLDMSFAFHTDAGTTLNDSLIGTLAIYTKLSDGVDVFPTGEPRFYNRYLCDMVQTQIVNDIRALYEPLWQRRGIWDRSYSESRTPKVPAMLLELLSHQNFADMRYGLDPTFRFTVSRAVYKGILRYLNFSQGREYVVQPLPVKSFVSKLDGNVVKLKWKPVSDSLEPTALPEGYIVYVRTGEDGFDGGRYTASPDFSMEVERGKIYSFRVTAVNSGGESFPSETLSVYKAPDERGTILIVNGFDRISAPCSYASKDTSFAGFMDYKDSGVPYIKDISYIGSQYEYRRNIPWMDDDSPGFGASYADYETRVIAGNTFDYPYVHGKAFANSGFSFVSCSRDALTDSLILLEEYPAVDLIMGKQIQTVTGRDGNKIKYKVFPIVLQQQLRNYANHGGKILLSGANIATDIWDSIEMDQESKDFAMQVLKFKWRSNSASRCGEVARAQSPWAFSGTYKFHTTPNERSYSVESPDGIEPSEESARTIFRYSDNNLSAGVAFKGNYSVVSLGFPIETLISQEQINNIIDTIVKFFEL
jgi:hypothetical protein